MILIRLSQGQSASFAESLDAINGTVSGVSSLDVTDFNKDGLMDVVQKGGSRKDGRFTLVWFEQGQIR
ncbi:MAG: hypothetical protein IPL46_19680 [Saprospiraceae bacterium]|nr:hypothetical protein [Saprospiraceae bacterium]